MSEQAAPSVAEMPDEFASPPVWRSRARFVAWRFLVIAAFVLIGVLAYMKGQQLREWTWNYTGPIHFYPDMNNGYYWGSQAWEPTNRPPGILNVYDVVAADAERRAAEREQELKRRPRRFRNQGEIEVNPEYRLDYAPLRLALISTWVRWTQTAHPEKAAEARRAAQNGSNSTFWIAPFEFYKPMLDFNTAIELFGMAGLFLLARHWVVRGWRGTAKPAIAPGRGWPWYRAIDWFNSDNPFRGWIAGTMAALLFWFNPVILLSAHGWPTWDMWVIPFFIWAIYLACIDWWFVSGVVLATAAMFKGQQLLVAPLFVLWPIFAGRPLMALRWAAGAVFGVAAIASPWLLTCLPDGVKPAIGARELDRPAVMWLAAITVVTLVLPVGLKLLRPWRQHNWHPAARWGLWTVLLAIAAACVFGPFRDGGAHWAIGLAFTLLVVAGIALAPLRWTPVLGAGAIGIALLLCGQLYNGSMNWLNIGWGYGTRHYPYMQVGMSDNLGGLLQRRFSWEPNETAFRYREGLTPGLMASIIAAYVLVYVGCVKVGVNSWRKNLTWRPVLHAGIGVALCLLYVFVLAPKVQSLAWYTERPTHTRGLGIPADAEALTLPIRTVLVTLYVVMFIPCVIGAAMHFRRNDPRFLVAITGVWAVFFGFLPQMHERYLIYAAGVACSLTAVSTGYTLLGVFMSLWTTMMTFHPMLSVAERGDRLRQFLSDVSPTASVTLKKILGVTHPDMGWAVILCAVFFVYGALAPRKRPVGLE